MRNTRSGLSATLMLAAAMGAMGGGLMGMPLSQSLRGGNRRPTAARTALQREIDEHNAAVDKRKAEKRAAKTAA